ncbi:DUF2975 domain-containing protein [Robiginitomaculum antarcticum]|uniref:DUF2975 domain-containing protein n=1 Tax=Robiginitomaculum antarcticum TaxID=437507 RepID=UPI000361C960|nr:DUF2975 domain-containing protein [Robiginitomaculum antarcticum]
MSRKNTDSSLSDGDDLAIDFDDVALDGQPLRSAMALDIFLAFMNVLAWVWLALMLIGFGIALFLATGQMIPGFETLADVPERVLIIILGVRVTGAVVAILVLYELRKISATLLRGDPFVPRNAARLRRIWITVAIGEIIFTILMFMVTVYVWNNPDLNFANHWFGEMTGLNEGEKKIPLRWEVWSLVLILIVLAQVFRQGADMREQEKLTV